MFIVHPCTSYTRYILVFDLLQRKLKIEDETEFCTEDLLHTVLRCKVSGSNEALHCVQSSVKYLLHWIDLNYVTVILPSCVTTLSVDGQTVFDNLEGEEMRRARTRSNPYETIRGGIFLNRSVFTQLLIYYCGFSFYVICAY